MVSMSGMDFPTVSHVEKSVGHETGHEDIGIRSRIFSPFWVRGQFGHLGCHMMQRPF